MDLSGNLGGVGGGLGSRLELAVGAQRRRRRVASLLQLRVRRVQVVLDRRGGGRRRLGRLELDFDLGGGGGGGAGGVKLSLDARGGERGGLGGLR